MDATSFRKPQQRGAAVVRAAKAKEKARLAEAARRAPRGGKRGRSRKRSRSRAAAAGGDATAPLRTTDLLGIADASAATQAATEAALLADATRQSEIRAQRLVLFKQQNAQMGKVLDYLLREDRCVSFFFSCGPHEGQRRSTVICVCRRRCQLRCQASG